MPAQLQLIPQDRNNKILNEIDEETWNELFVSGIIRSIIINEDFERKLPGLIERIPFQSLSISKLIVEKFVLLMDRGHLIGARASVQKPSIKENYLLDTLYKIVDLTDLYEFTIDLIETHYGSKFEFVIIRLLFNNNNEIKAIKRLYKGIQNDPRDSLLLIEQIEFLLSRNNIELAREVALKAVDINPISFNSWYYLVKSEILNNNIANALIALNSAPMYTERGKDIITLTQADVKHLPNPHEGKIQFVWANDPLQVHGLNSNNLIKFSSKYEVQAVDPALLRINRQQLKGTYKKAYELLILIINRIGWDGLLKIRSNVFIMDEEYKQNLSSISIKSEPMNDSNFKSKRLCEKWLDDLFLIIYEDLRIVLIVANELSNQKQLKHSALEWELIGLTCYRTGHYKNCISALRTSISAKFDIISALKLLKLWELNYFDRQFQIINQGNPNGEIGFSLDQMLDILLKSISYYLRFYNDYQINLLLLLKKVIHTFDPEYIKNKIQIFFENDNNDYNNSGVIPPFDKLIDLLQSLNKR